MDRLKFESIPGVEAFATTNDLTLLLRAAPRTLKEIKKMLTVRNKSAKWAVDNAKKRLEHWEQYDPSFMAEEAKAILAGKIEACKTIIAENEPLIVQEFYEETDEGLEVPAGFWWLAEKVHSSARGGTHEGVHRNGTIPQFFLSKLRPYQVDGLKELYKYNRATCVLATGLGKSLIIASLCCATVKAGRRACVVVPTDYLVGQMHETISQYIENCKAYGGKRKDLPLGASVLVITAASAAKFITDYHTIIIDESHHSPAATWVDLLTAAEKATHVYNLTATAFRADGMDLAIHAFGGPVVYERDCRWGIANGWLKPLKAYVATVTAKRADSSEIILSDKMPATKAYSILTKNEQTLAYAKKMLMLALGKGRKCMVLFKTVEAGKAFRDLCAPDVKFDVASSEFRKPLNDFRDGKTLVSVLVSNDRLVSEGIDIPELDCLITMIQNHGDITTYQAVGRILRKPEGCTGDAIVIDISTTGYAQFDRAQIARAKVYGAITDEISLVSL